MEEIDIIWKVLQCFYFFYFNLILRIITLKAAVYGLCSAVENSRKSLVACRIKWKRKTTSLASKSRDLESAMGTGMEDGCLEE